MSVQGTYVGNVYPPICQTLAGTTTTLIDAAMPNNAFTLASFAICNATGGAVTTDLYWYDISTTTEHLVWQKSVAANSTELVSDIPLRLRRGDEIRVKGAASVRVTLIFIENFQLR